VTEFFKDLPIALVGSVLLAVAVLMLGAGRHVRPRWRSAFLNVSSSERQSELTLSTGRAA
jgi:hypothetical protein